MSAPWAVARCRPSSVVRGIIWCSDAVSCLAEPDSCVESAERPGRPPVPSSEQPHQRVDEQGADYGGVDQDGGGGGNMRQRWLIDELAYAGDEHLDPGF